MLLPRVLSGTERERDRAGPYALYIQERGRRARSAERVRNGERVFFLSKFHRRGKLAPLRGVQAEAFRMLALLMRTRASYIAASPPPF